MTEQHSPSDTLIGIVGAGIMGRGIAQIAAEAGLGVLIADARADAVGEAVAAARAMIRRKAEKGQIDAAAEAACARIEATAAGPESGWGAFAGCDLVIEAVVERLDVKHAVIAGLEAVVRDDCILASNTSSLSVTAIASAARRPERVAGFHFFNPVPLMKVVEVIGGVLTAPTVLDRLTALARRMGHHPVGATDTPGFLVNHAGRGYLGEAWRIVSEGIAGFADIDRVMTEACGFRMGPFELMDLTGLDVSHAVMESIYHQYYEEPRYRPAVMATQRRIAGLLGRKSGRGFYAYADGKATKPAEAPAPAVPLAGTAAWVGCADAAIKAGIEAILAAAGVSVEAGAAPSAAALIVVAPFGADATTTAVDGKLDAVRTVAIDPLGLGKRRTLMPTPVTAPEMLARAHAAFAADGAGVTITRDSPGFIAQRILAAIVNVGCDIAQQRVATPPDIDRAVELGLGYPRGPLRLGDEIGPARVLAVLEAMAAFYAEPRYRASPWLKRRALLGVSLRTED